MMNSVSIHATDLKNLQVELSNAVSTNFQATLAIVFSASKFDSHAISEIFRKENIQMLGCSTAGEIVDESLYEGGIAALLMDMDAEHFRIHYSEHQGENIYQAAFAAGTFTKNAFAEPGIIIMSGGMTVNADVLIAGLKDGLGKEVPMYGGLAADDLRMTTTWAFTHKKATSSGFATLVVDTDKYAMTGMATSGWEALGGVNTITEAEGNVVYTINDEPAYDVFIRYFGILENEASKAEKLLSIQTNYPLQFQRQGGYSVLRSPLQIDEKERTIRLAAGVNEGDSFRFSSSPGFEVIEQTVEEFGDLREKSADADAVILFSCKGRHGAFGPVLEDEIGGIYAHWNAPMIGFLSYGEIGNMGSGTCEFHNETCSLVLIRELGN